MKKSPYEKAIDYALGTIVMTTCRTLVWAMIPLLQCFVLYHFVTPDIGLVYSFYLATLFFGFGFVFPYWTLIKVWAFGKRRLSNFQEFLGRCFCLLLLLFYYPKAKANLLRGYLIGQQLFQPDPHKYMLQEIERVERDADLKVKFAEKNIKRDTEKERKRLQKLLTWAKDRKERFYIKHFVGVAQAISMHIHNIEDHSHFHEENLTGLFERYRHAFPAHKQLIENKYKQRMTPLEHDPKLPNISPKQTTLEGKLLYLAVLIRSHKDYHYDQLDFEKSDFAEKRYVFTQSRSAIDLKHWKKHLPAINAYLGGEWTIEPLDGTSLLLYKLKELLPLIPFTPDLLQEGQIFYGYNVRTGEPYYNSLDKIPHHLVVGQSGSGKSVFLNQIMASFLYNIEQFEKLFLVDLKGGVELSKYDNIHPNIQLIDDYDDLPGVVETIYKAMRDRLTEMKNKGETFYSGKHIGIIVDEHAQIAQYVPVTTEEKKQHQLLISYLNRISMLGRAARLFLWTQLQKATTDNIHASYRSNHQTKICFKVHSNSEAASVFGGTDDLPGISSIGGFRHLAKGRYIFDNDVEGEAIYMQATLVDDAFPLARLLKTAAGARVECEEQNDVRARPSELVE